MPFAAMRLAKKTYHMRRKEKEIKGDKELLELLGSRPFITIAMCRDDEPYLVTVNYAVDPKTRRVYFHCASQGKKLDFLDSNPHVCAQVLEDRGYVKGKCDYDYATVNLTGIAKEVVSVEEKSHAFDLLLEKFEPGLDVSDARKRFIDGESFGRVSIYGIDIKEMTGKMRVP